MMQRRSFLIRLPVSAAMMLLGGSISLGNAQTSDLEQLMALPIAEKIVDRLTDESVERIVSRAVEQKTILATRIAAFFQENRQQLRDLVRSAAIADLSRRTPDEKAALLEFAKSNDGLMALERYSEPNPLTLYLKEMAVPSDYSVQTDRLAAASKLIELPSVDDGFALISADRDVNRARRAAVGAAANEAELILRFRTLEENFEEWRELLVVALAQTHTQAELTAMEKLVSKSSRFLPGAILKLPESVAIQMLRQEMISAEELTK